MTARVEEIRARTEAATPEPWETEPEECDEWYGNHIGVRVSSEKFGESFPVFGEHREANADFIANARTDIPWLLAVVDQLAEALEQERRLRKEFGEYLTEPQKDAAYHNALSVRAKVWGPERMRHDPETT